jgi:hypothetical protein
MSLLSTPTGRPERVFSLLALVRALGGRVSASDAREWLAPQYRGGEATGSGDDVRGSKTGDRVREVFRVARDLTFLEADKDDWVSTRELPATRTDFAREVHAHLRKLPANDPDAVLLRAFAWCAAYSEVHGIYSLISKSAGEFAADVAAALGRSAEGDDDRSFNTTKLSAWKDWMSFLGLGWNDLPGQPGFLPDPSTRFEEELMFLVSPGARIDAKSFVEGIGRTFPYLDGGLLFDEACSTGLTRPPVGQLSRLLSQTLRMLEDRQILRLDMEGDAKDGIALHPDPVAGAKTFSYIERLPRDTDV